jgi:hypothetical protein
MSIPGPLHSPYLIRFNERRSHGVHNKGARIDISLRKECDPDPDPRPSKFQSCYGTFLIVGFFAVRAGLLVGGTSLTA